MSAKKSTTKDAQVEGDSPDDSEVERDPTVDALEDIVKPPPEQRSSTATPAANRGSRAVAWLALFVSVAVAVAVGAFAYLSYQEAAGDAVETSSEANTLRASIGTTQDALESLEQRVAALSEGDAERIEQIDSVSNQMNLRLRQLESLPDRLSSIESSMASIQGISTGARDAWLLAEAEYYMQIANVQLQLANNPELATLALTHADDRIRQLGDPRHTNIRQALSDELRALKTINKPDIAGITLTLASLAGVVDSLPLRQEVVVSEERGADIDPEPFRYGSRHCLTEECGGGRRVGPQSG